MVAVTIEQTDPAGPSAPGAQDAFVESLMDTDLYSMGAFFCDQHPELVDEVVARSARDRANRPVGLRRRDEIDVEEAFGMLLTGPLGPLLQGRAG